jgi:ABC-type bacteriocin/lantibiotic exporter with double-glycine peptidase domain
MYIVLPLRSPFMRSRVQLAQPTAQAWIRPSGLCTRSRFSHAIRGGKPAVRSYVTCNSANKFNKGYVPTTVARNGGGGRVQFACAPAFGFQLSRQPPAFLAARASQMLVLTSIGVWFLSRNVSLYSRIANCDAFATRKPTIEVDKLDEDDDDLEPVSGSKIKAEETAIDDGDGVVLVSPKSNLALLWQLLQADRWLFAVAALSSILSSLAVSAQARVIGAVFDLIGSSDPMAFVGSAQQLLVLFALQSALSFLASVSLAMATNRLGESLRCEFFAAILRQDIASFDETKSGELAHQLAQDISELQSSLRTAFTTGIESVTALLSGSVVLYMTSQKLALSVLAMLPLAAMSASLLGHTLRDLSLSVHHASNKTTGIATESIGAIRTVRAFAAEDRELKRYSASLGRVTQLKQQMALAAGGFYACLHFGINCTSLLICGYGGYLVSTGELTKGGIAAAVTQVQSLERAMGKLSILAAKW